MFDIMSWLADYSSSLMLYLEARSLFPRFPHSLRRYREIWESFLTSFEAEHRIQSFGSRANTTGNGCYIINQSCIIPIRPRLHDSLLVGIPVPRDLQSWPLWIWSTTTWRGLYVPCVSF